MLHPQWLARRCLSAIEGRTATKSSLRELGGEGHKTCKVAIRRIQYRPGRCLGTIAADATDANGCLLSVIDNYRELHQTEIKLTNLRTLDVLETQLGHGSDQAVYRLDGRIGRCALQMSR